MNTELIGNYTTIRREWVCANIKPSYKYGEQERMWFEWTVLTDLLDGGRALSKHTQGTVDYFPVESPGGAVVPKGNVFTISSQDIGSHLHHTQDRDGQGTKHEWALLLRRSSAR